MRIAINGFGRIGKSILRNIIQNDNKNIEIVSINCGTSASIEMHMHLFKYDSVHGIFNGHIEIISDFEIKINNKIIKIIKERDINNIKWDNIDVVFECTGQFLTEEKATLHIKQGAKNVILSAPTKDDKIPTILYKINDTNFNSLKNNIISIGSCTTNCVAPIIQTLHSTVKIQKAFLTTIHSYTSDQNLVDGVHTKDFRRARAAAMSMIPTSTGASKTIEKIFPELKGKISGSAIRVPTINVSILDISILFEENININTKDDINQLFKESSMKKLNGIMSYSEEPLVSIDYVGNPHSTIIDGLETQLIDKNLARIFAWYDNEWSFAIRMIELAEKLYY